MKENIFELPIGVMDKDGALQREVEICNMIGSDEESITDKKVAQNPSVVITTLLARKITRVGTIDKITPQLVRSMFTGDRDMCLMEIRKLSLGNEMKFTIQCPDPDCKQKYEVTVDLEDDIDIVYWDKEADPIFDTEKIGYLPFELPDGYTDKDGETHKRGIIKLPNGDIEEKLATMLRQNPGKANTALLCACIQELGDLKMVDTKVLREMTRRDREYLTSLLKDAHCGPDFQREVECPYCGNIHKISLELPYFFTANSNQ